MPGRRRCYPHLHQRFAAGCNNATRLWREISAQGYGGKAGMIRRYIKRLRVRTKALGVKRELEIQSAADNFRSPSSRRAAWWLIRESEDLTADQQMFVDQLIGLCPDIGRIKDLAVSFRRMITRREANQFEKWLTKARESAVTEFRSFAEGLKKDQHAVVEALRSEWSIRTRNLDSENGSSKVDNDHHEKNKKTTYTNIQSANSPRAVQGGSEQAVIFSKTKFLKTQIG